MIKREKNKKHDCPTKAKKHRADRALSKFSAFNKLTARLKVLYYQSPTFFSQTVGSNLKKHEIPISFPFSHSIDCFNTK